MNGHRLVARLHDHQTAILASTERARRTLAEEAPDPVVLARLRWEMVRLMTAYQFFKHREVFDVLIANGSDDEARIARRLKADCISLGEDVRRYVAYRNSADQTGTWAQQREQGLSFVGRIRQHLDHERRAMIALLGRNEGERASIIAPPVVRHAQRAG